MFDKNKNKYGEKVDIEGSDNSASNSISWDLSGDSLNEEFFLSIRGVFISVIESGCLKQIIGRTLWILMLKV